MEKHIKNLKEKGFRITKARKAVIKILTEEHCALSIQDLVKLLKIQSLSPDTSTLYREIQFLTEQGIAQEVVFKDGKMRYELNSDDHHHHLVCTKCKNVSSVDMEDDLHHLEDMIKQKKGFRVSSHSLEFYGTCKSCL